MSIFTDIAERKKAFLELSEDTARKFEMELLDLRVEQVKDTFDFVENNWFIYDEEQDIAYYKLPFDQIDRYDFKSIFERGFYYGDSEMCVGDFYETWMKDTENNGVKPYILACYNKKRNKETGELEKYIEFIDRTTKTTTTDIELVFALYKKGDKIYIADHGIRYNEETICIDKINIICQFFNMRHETKISQNIFYDKGKIAFSEIILQRLATENGLISKSINKKIVMNIKTGKTYKLNDYDLNTRKKVNLKRSPFMCLSLWSLMASPMIYSLNLKKEDVNKIGEIIQKEAGNDAIPFDQYIKNCKSDYNSDYNFFKYLVAYNTNPYVPYSVLYNMYLIKSDAKIEKNNSHRCFNKKFTCKTVRNKNVVEEMTKFLTTEGYNKKFINFKLNSNRATTYLRDKEVYDEILALTTIKDKNNKWKMINAYFTNDFGSMAMQDFFESKLYNDLLIAHNENNVINAIIKVQDVYELLRITRSYEYIKQTMPEYKLPKRLRLKEICGTVELDYKKLRNNSYEYSYNTEIKELLNKTINGYKFTLATTSDELVTVGSKMSICVGEYTTNVAKKQCMIVYVTKEDKYVGCIEIQPENGAIIQAKAQHNEHFTGELLQAFNEYARTNKLDTNECCDLTHQSKSLSGDIINFNLSEFKATIKIPKVMSGTICYDEYDYEEYLNQQRQQNGIHEWTAEVPVLADEDIPF